MKLSDRDRRILAQLESQFTAATTPPSTSGPARSRMGPQWTVIPSAVLGILLLAAGTVLNVGSAALMGGLLLGWWAYPSVPGLLRRIDSAVNPAADSPPGGER